MQAVTSVTADIVDDVGILSFDTNDHHYVLTLEEQVPGPTSAADTGSMSGDVASEDTLESALLICAAVIRKLEGITSADVDADSGVLTFTVRNVRSYILSTESES